MGQGADQDGVHHQKSTPALIKRQAVSLDSGDILWKN